MRVPAEGSGVLDFFGGRGFSCSIFSFFGRSLRAACCVQVSVSRTPGNGVSKFIFECQWVVVAATAVSVAVAKHAARACHVAEWFTGFNLRLVRDLCACSFRLCASGGRH